LMGIGVSFFTEGVGAGPRKHMDILGLAMNGRRPAGAPVGQGSSQHKRPDARTRPRDDVRADRRRGLGIPPEDVEVRHGDTDRSPYGLGTWQPLDAGVGPRSRSCRAGARQGASDRRDHARDEAGRSRVGEEVAGTSGDPEKAR
jgi:CO/xanthine dehydrogenase Mo-binding subunit